jgi:CBS domain-containing protein
MERDMGQKLREVMTPNPVTVSATANAVEAAKAMRDNDVGDVVVSDGDEVRGILTDRDITVRVVAGGHDPTLALASEISSQDVTTVTPDTDVDTAVSLMREKAIRRLPVVENGQPVGVVSIGDLARERDPGSALADISSAPPNT